MQGRNSNTSSDIPKAGIQALSHLCGGRAREGQAGNPRGVEAMDFNEVLDPPNKDEGLAGPGAGEDNLVTPRDPSYTSLAWVPKTFTPRHPSSRRSLNFHLFLHSSFAGLEAAIVSAATLECSRRASSPRLAPCA
jgi:hypothetical protein